MDNTDTEGLAITVTPRGGRLFELGRAGAIALFAGANYLKTDLTVSGSVGDAGGNFTIDYTIEQSNSHRWNAVLGANWDIVKRWSWSLEYNGFGGSREAVISALTRRF